MSNNLDEKINGLLTKYTELLLGEADADHVEKVKAWILYSHMSKSMPALVKHWNDTYPDAKNEIKETINEIKELNEAHRQAKE
ncbi:YusU family protein [Robertmurraya korlensis]|uniref:YusU family protein n=1 Tax=Robertmurraya korlensis TaxID=519977 RepID=UPI002040C03B|nr:YusU family protein [Robertmurraya korlensis]